MNHYRALSGFIIGLCFLGFFGLSAAHAVAVSSAGKVIAADGSVDALNANQEKRPVKRGDNFYVEDTILTSDQSTVSLRFTDGTLVELKEKTSYKIKEYQFKEKSPEDDSYSAELIKGGFRTITGALGKRNPDHYEVQARSTTLTIRGTKVMMDIVPDTSEVGDLIGTLNVQVGLIEGGATVTSGGNKVDLTPNTNAVVNSNGYIVRGVGIPPSMLRGFSSDNINTLIEQSKKAGYPTAPDGTPASTSSTDSQTTFIEGEGKTKPPAAVGGTSPCEGVAGMSSAMP